MCLFNKDLLRLRLRLHDMEIRSTFFIFIFLFSVLIATYAPGVTGEVNNGEPLEAQCRPYVEEALKKLETGEVPADIEQLDAKLDVSEKAIDDDSSLPVSDKQASEEDTSAADQETSQETNNETNEDTSMEDAEHFETKDQVSNEIEGETDEIKEKDQIASTENAADDETIHTVTSKNVDTGSAENSDDATISKENESEERKANEEEGKIDDDSSKTASEETEDKSEESKQTISKEEQVSEDSLKEATEGDTNDKQEESTKSTEESNEQTAETTEEAALKSEEKSENSVEQAEASTEQTESSTEQTEASAEQTEASTEQTEASAEQTEASAEQTEASAERTEVSTEQTEASAEQTEASAEQAETSAEQTETSTDDTVTTGEPAEASDEQPEVSGEQSEDSAEQVGASDETPETITGDKLVNTETSKENDVLSNEQDEVMLSKETFNETSAENKESETEEIEISTEIKHVAEEMASQELPESGSQEKQIEESNENIKESSQEAGDVSKEGSVEEVDALKEKTDSGEISNEKESDEVVKEGQKESTNSEEITSQEEALTKESIEDTSSEDAQRNASAESLPEEDLMQAFDIPTNLRPRSHISEILHLDDDSNEIQKVVNKASEVILKDLKRIYENAIKPLETLYKYRDLSNRHFGDPEIFSKPLVLFMGPWSGGKSSIINYLLDNEYTSTSLRTGAEPSPAYFNILMWGEKPEMLDGTQLAADWTFSGLQKFGQGLEERLSGLKLPSKLLEKVNIVEIPGILEVRKQVSRVFPFNDACQWFIDRADIIFLVYDPSKLDVGPETEAILDQLKGREYQTRILLNKADQVKAEELMRVQGALIWNISPLMSSAQPPVMYLTSLWSRPYEDGAPVRLLQAQERSFLRDIKSAVDKRIENKIASARRFAVRVRNHAKMVDCYLTTYYNHKSVFANKKIVSDQIIEHPQDYHIYEGLSTLTNISRYDLPDPDVYRDFFRLNPLYEFQQLSATCTYFRGCPINRLDVAIAYDFPELVGKYKKMVEATTTTPNNKAAGNS